MTPRDDACGRVRDERMWQVATWALPFAVQAVIAVTVTAAWLLGAVLGGVDDDGARRTIVLAATGIAVAVSVAAGGVLLVRPSPDLRGVALGVLASAGIVLIGGVGLAVSYF